MSSTATKADGDAPDAKPPSHEKPPSPSDCAISDTRWPSALPSEDEEQVMSIVCGNSHLHWAIHRGPRDGELAPSLFWRTPHLSDNDVTPAYQTDSLSRHLPSYPHEFVFGKNGEGTVAAAVEASENRTVQQLTIYIISTNSDQLQRLCSLWAGVPCRLYKMDGNDFYTEDQGRYEGMGVDRLATLRGAAEVHGYPALVFDGGTATTYTAADENGHIMGGGIGPGIGIKFKSLSDFTGLPHIDINAVMVRVKEAAEQKKPISTFATDTGEAMLGMILAEFAHAGRSVIKNWASKFPGKGETLHGLKQNKERAVVMTGGDGEILSQLFLSDFGGILEGGSPIDVEEGFEIMHAKHLIHYGVQAAVMEKVRERRRKDDKEAFLAGGDMEGVAARYMDKRVAKWFAEPDANGDHYYRGSITKIFKGETDKGKETVLFRLEFDDGDGEDAEIEELGELFKNFENVGEPKSPVKSSKQKAKVKRKSQGRSKKRATSGTSASDQQPQPAMPVPKTKRPKVNYASNPGRFVGTRIAKDFGKDLGIYFGTISDVTEEDGQILWTIEYDDGDAEDFDVKDLKRAQAFYQDVKCKDTGSIQSESTKNEVGEGVVENESAAAPEGIVDNGSPDEVVPVAAIEATAPPEGGGTTTAEPKEAASS